MIWKRKAVLVLKLFLRGKLESKLLADRKRHPYHLLEAFQILRPGFECQGQV